MKILWFAGNPALYANKSNYNGGGWIASLQYELMKFYGNKITLTIAFPWTNGFMEKKDNITYYGIKTFKHSYFRPKYKEKKTKEMLKNIVDEVNPDIILVFGTEERFGLVSYITNKPVVIHLQGILSAVNESYMPQNMNWYQYYFYNFKNVIFKYNMNLFIDREQRIFKNCKYYIGRTEWDHALTNLFAKGAKYYTCDEMLRPQIYNSTKYWQYYSNNKLKLISIISEPVFKGGDIILRTAKFIKEKIGIDFEWNVYGVDNMKIWERITKINSNKVNVNIKGIINSNQLIDAIIDSHIMIHPSYIENSSNTICEGQLLGIPIIANNVGGISSIINNHHNGILVPANDIYTLSYHILRLYSNPDIANTIGHNARIDALIRHKPLTIIENLFNIFNSIIENHE